MRRSAAVSGPRENYGQRTLAQLTETVLGEAMSMEQLFEFVGRDTLSPRRPEVVPEREPVTSVSPARRTLTEIEIREVLRTVVSSDDDREIVGAVEEFWVPSVHVRADLVVIGRDLHAFEIKSDADTLKRLPRQVAGFSSLFDRCTIVVAPKHLEQAIDQVPDWWGVAVAESEELDWRRKPEPNPCVEVDRVVRLLWRDEVLGLLEAAGVTPDLVGGRAGMWRQALSALDPASIREGVRRALASRSAWHEEDGRSRFTAVPAPAR